MQVPAPPLPPSSPLHVPCSHNLDPSQPCQEQFPQSARQNKVQFSSALFFLFFFLSSSRQTDTGNFLTFVKTTAIAYGQKMGQSLKILVACNSGRFYKRQKVTSRRPAGAPWGSNVAGLLADRLADWQVVNFRNGFVLSCLVLCFVFIFIFYLFWG